MFLRTEEERERGTKHFSSSLWQIEFSDQLINLYSKSSSNYRLKKQIELFCALNRSFLSDCNLSAV